MMIRVVEQGDSESDFNTGDAISPAGGDRNRTATHLSLVERACPRAGGDRVAERDFG
jgi:hypothetical protein